VRPRAGCPNELPPARDLLPWEPLGASPRKAGRFVRAETRSNVDTLASRTHQDRAEASDPFGTPGPPATIGRYELRREIGRGSMGVVYEAFDPALGRVLAIKTIRLAFDASAEEFAVFERRFLDEARIAAGLSHPGIVVVHDVGRDATSGELFIAMEHLTGRTLAEILRSGESLSWREVLGIARQVARALHYAHAHGVVHRDLKPANVMLMASGEAKIMDFGIAKAQAARVSLTAAGLSIGTPLYSSPEQVLGEPTDGRSDVFALGAVAYSLLTGGHPAFAAESIAAVVARVVGSDPAPPSSFAPGLPVEVDRLVTRALAKDPAARYPDAAALCAEIDGILASPDDRPAGVLRSADGRWDALPLASDTLSMESSGNRRPAAEAARSKREESRPARRPLLGRGGLAVAALCVVGGLAVGLSSMLAGSVTPGKRVESAASAIPVPATGEAPREVEPVTPSGGLAVRFERLPDDASVHVWVDRALVAGTRCREAAEGQDRVLLFGDEGADRLGLSPGGHDVEVEVTWSGRRLSSTIWGTVRTGATRRLRARVGGLVRKKLSLEWE
jgi:serine/threonine protein kinase